MNRSQGNLDSSSVVVSAGAVDVAVGNLLGRGGADVDDFDAESQCLSSHLMVEIHSHYIV